MYITTKPASPGMKYVYVVAGEREGNHVRQRIVAYLGALEDDRIPYLKAAFAKREKRPLLVERKAG